MKKEDFFEVLGDMDPKSVKAAGEYKKTSGIKWSIILPCAAAALLAALGVFFLRRAGRTEMPGTEGSGGAGTYKADVVAVEAAYPEAVGKELTVNQFFEGDLHGQWWSERLPVVKEAKALFPEMEGYYTKMMGQLLQSEDENTVCSPLNTYMAFSMLAEVTDGNTRQQLLDMLGGSDMEGLRKNVKLLWECNYADTPAITSLLANSLWLNKDMTYNEDTLKLLADQYYASSYRGTPGSSEMDKALQNWTDENTKGLLAEYTKAMKLDPETALGLVSTIYYKAMWQSEFEEANTSKGVFHGTRGEQEVDYMHAEENLRCYSTDTYTSVGLSLSDSGAMYFYLPKEGTDVNDLAADPKILQATVENKQTEESKNLFVSLSLPKFKVSGKQDLKEILNRLGVTDVLDPSLADFTPLMTNGEGLSLSSAEHAAMVEIDEKGVTGAAVTSLIVAGSVIPDDRMEFVLDRPFLFVITGEDGSVLFSGVIRNIE